MLLTGSSSSKYYINQQLQIQIEQMQEFELVTVYVNLSRSSMCII